MAARTTAPKTAAKPAATPRTRTAKPQADPLAEMQAQIEALTALVTAGVMSQMGTTTPADPPAAETGVQATGTYVAPAGQPTLTDPDSPASLKQKRLWADLQVREYESTGRKLTKGQTDALAAYTQALNRVLVSLGISGAANATKADAQISISALNAAADLRKAAARKAR